MSESTKQYNIQGSRVYGKGWSYNLTNKTDAVHLCERLNTYELTTNNTNDKQLKQIHKKLENIELTLNEIKEALK